MARLTNTDRETLRQALAAAERTQAFLSRDDVFVAKETRYPLSKDYTAPSRPALRTIEKQAGSDLVAVTDAISILANFLATH